MGERKRRMARKLARMALLNPEHVTKAEIERMAEDLRVRQAQVIGWQDLLNLTSWIEPQSRFEVMGQGEKFLGLSLGPPRFASLRFGNVKPPRIQLLEVLRQRGLQLEKAEHAQYLQEVSLLEEALYSG